MFLNVALIVFHNTSQCQWMSLSSSNLILFELHFIKAVEKSYSFHFKECIHGKLVRWTNPGGMQMAKIRCLST